MKAGLVGCCCCQEYSWGSQLRIDFLVYPFQWTAKRKREGVNKVDNRCIQDSINLEVTKCYITWRKMAVYSSVVSSRGREAPSETDEGFSSSSVNFCSTFFSYVCAILSAFLSTNVPSGLVCVLMKTSPRLTFLPSFSSCNVWKKQMGYEII